jgi:hypothetical protein
MNYSFYFFKENNFINKKKKKKIDKKFLELDFLSTKMKNLEE